MKYICVGQPKTGTKSMACIFNLLNYKVNRNPICIDHKPDFITLDNDILFYTNDDISKCHQILETFEAFHDYPYSFNYQYINDNFPNSKFILTVRDPDSWFTSYYKYQDRKNMANKQVLQKLYDCSKFNLSNKENIISKYIDYNQKIINYFDDKPGKLLIIDLSKDNDVKKKLNDYLKVNIDFDIPHLNKGLTN